MADLEQKLAALHDLHYRSAASLGDVALWAGLALGLTTALLFVLVRGLGRAGALRREAVAVFESTLGLPPDERLAAQVKLLRRIQRSRGDPGGAVLKGDPWLAALDRMFRTTFFSLGAGRSYAHDLYVRAGRATDPPAADEMRALLTRMQG